MDPTHETPPPFTADIAPDMAWLTFGDYRLAVMPNGDVGFFVAVYAAAEIAAMAPDDDWPAARQHFELPRHWDLPTIGPAPRGD